MKKNYAAVVLMLTMVFTACTSTKEPSGVWLNKEKAQGKSFHKLFIVAMTADIQARVQVENDLASTAKARGFDAVKSIDVMAPSLKDPTAPSKDEILNKVKGSGCDGILVASLLKKEQAMQYTPGVTAYAPMPYYSWNGGFYGYYSNMYQTVSSSGYYTQDKSYFMQTNLYDVATEEIMLSVQSTIFNPSSLKAFSEDYTLKLVKQLKSEGLLKKK